MRVSVFEALTNATPLVEETTWETLVADLAAHGHRAIATPLPPSGADRRALKKHEKPFKESHALFSPAEFLAARSSASVVRLHFGVLDFDGYDLEVFRRWIGHVVETGLEAYVYTSWSHLAAPAGATPLCAWRCLVPFDCPVEAYAWPAFWPRLDALLGGIADKTCADPSRAYFLPACPSYRAHAAEAFRLPGRPLETGALLAGAAPPPASRPAPLIAVPAQPVDRDEVVALARKLKRRSPGLAAALTAVLAGEPWAEDGERDVTLYRVAGALAREFPTASPESLAALFVTSASHYGGEYPPSVVVDKLERQQAEARQREQRKVDDRAQATRLHLLQTFRGERESLYTLAEVDGFAASIGATSAADFAKSWILQRSASFYFYVSGRGYVGPYSEKDGRLAAHTLLAPATSVGVRLTDTSDKGVVTPRPVHDLALDYGTVARNAVADLTATRTHYDPSTDTIVEAPCPLRPLPPRFDTRIDAWLRALAGDQYEHLETWLAWLTDLSLPSAALFVSGESTIGKSLIAEGLARLWSAEGPTTIDQLSGNFNAAVANCPLVFADEEMPKELRRNSAKVRQIIQARSRPFTRKFLPDAHIRGAVRLIIAANNTHLLEGEESLTPQDVEAIAIRFLHIDAKERSAAIRRCLTDTTGWVDADLIARHALYLRANVARSANPPRFLIDRPAAAGRSLVNRMATSTNAGGAVAQWLVRFLLDPKALRAGRPPGDAASLIRVRGGILYASPKTITDFWDRYSTKLPGDRLSARQVSIGLQAIADAGLHQLDIAGRLDKPRLLRLRLDALIQWAESTGYASAEDIASAVRALEDVDGPAPAPQTSAQWQH